MSEVINCFVIDDDDVYAPHYFYPMSKGDQIELHKLEGMAALGFLFMCYTPFKCYEAYIQREVITYAKSKGYRRESHLKQKTKKFKKSVKFEKSFSLSNRDQCGKELTRLTKYLDIKQFHSILIEANQKFWETHLVH